MSSNSTETELLSSLAEFPLPSASERGVLNYKSRLLKSTVDQKIKSLDKDIGTASAQISPVDVASISRPMPSVRIPSVKLHDPNTLVTFSPLQEWEGYVVHIGDNFFTANLIDKTAGKTRAEEQIDFDLADLSDDDRQMLRLGAIFRWLIGYQKLHGTKKKVSDIIFRRLPAWTKNDFALATKRVDKIMETLTWE